MKNISLGPLEQAVMKCIWDQEATTARQVYHHLKRRRVIAYNTVQTIMTRLTKKGMLERKIDGKTHIYKAKRSQTEALKSVIRESMKSFIGQFGDQAVVAFIDGVDDLSEDVKKQLVQKLQEK